MKKHIITSVIMVSIALAASSAMCAEHQHDENQHAVAADSNAPADDMKLHSDCAQCGMNRGMFEQSRMLVTYADGKTAATCSIHCTAIELKNNKRKAVKSVQVGDYDSKKLIDAEKAFWVTGGDLQGVMTDMPKWAFAGKKGAEAFIAKHGGKMVTYREALNLAKKEVAK